jgi:predicted metal-dependent enzyme (double-stranded beta helix superfamily)
LQQQTDDAMTEIRSLAANDGEAGLSEIAVVLRRLASTQTWQEASLVAASPGEEVLYELDVTADGPSLYLVSDGQGVTSPPHEHGTWAVIAGVRGAEANVQFRPLSGRLVAPIDRVVVGAGESLVLSADAIHATEVVGAEPTFHLHLYGKPLRELSSFASRVFAGQAERENRA